MTPAIPREDPIRAQPGCSSRPPRRILALRLQALGDTIITLPYLNALRASFPGTGLDFLTRDEVADIPRSLELFE